MLIGIACLWGASATALDASGKRYVTMLASGGPGTMRSAAEDIFNTGMKDQEVLDVAAEVLTQNFNTNPKSETYSDAMAWICKALGNSNNGRYKALLEQVAKTSENRRQHKHCDRAAGDLPAVSNTYQAGSVDLNRYKEGGAAVSGASTKPTVAQPAKAAPPAGGAKSFSEIKEGMSQQEVESLIGPPTAMNSHVTGKAFIPFNFRGRDSYRLVALYKGVGHIVYSNSSAYSSQTRVLEIVNDPAESGFP
jgi:hypothetical protein